MNEEIMRAAGFGFQVTKVLDESEYWSFNPKKKPAEGLPVKVIFMKTEL